jgi:BASS family bile acid:Na+ symporter
MPALRKASFAVAGLGLVALLAGALAGLPGLARPGAVMAAVGLAIGAGSVSGLRGYQFTGWILAAVVAALLYPGAFLRWGAFDLRDRRIVLLVVQLVMFGMGTRMSLADLGAVGRAPRGVVVGIVCHFTIMPLVGFGLARLFRFPPEIAAGVILIGSCSSGLASNVMAYLARANLALSVAVTAITTLLAPLMTPLLMKLLAGTFVRVAFVDLMVEIVRIVIVPIGAALLHDYLKHASGPGRAAAWAGAGAATVVLAVLVATGRAGSLLGLPALISGAVVIGLAYHILSRLLPAMDRLMPTISMSGIVYFTTVTTAAGRDNLLQVGALLFLASVLHNGAGYVFGYGLSRALGLDVNSARSVAFEVGLQNGGMASGLAGAMGKLSTVGLAAAIFSPWMNISGSVLANHWRRRPVASPAPEP